MKAWVLCLLVACGDNSSTPPPDSLAVGPVTIDTHTLTLTIGTQSIDHFLTIGTDDALDETHYYDPTMPSLVTLRALDHAVGLADDFVQLDDGTKIRLGSCPIADCAALDIDASQSAHAVLMQVALPSVAGDPIYGTGDAATHANVAGTTRELELRIDTGSESGLNETHVPVPLVLWPRAGVGAFVADDRPGALDLAQTAPDRVTATMTLPVRGTYRVYLYTAQAPLDLVRGYVALTAKPAVPPRWAFAPQLWRNEWDSSDEVRGDATEQRTRHIPGSLMWIDNPWETAYNNFVVDETRLPQPAQLISDLAAQGFNVIFWSTPYVDADGLTAADHAAAASQQFLVEDDSGQPLDYPWAYGPGALVDFSRPGATAFWQQRIAMVTADGAVGFKLDFGEDLVPDVGGSIVAMETSVGDNQLMHARYGGLYHQAYLGAVPGGFLITRAGAWGEQATNTAIWPGDLTGDFSEHDSDAAGKRAIGGLPTAISRGLSLSVSGYPFYGSDIGGFRGFPTTENLIRWAEYASLGTIMQLGGGGTSHDPWDTTLFDPGTDVTYQIYAQLHMQLNPLLWTLALAAGNDGTPATRPARFIYDCACDDTMFLLGDDLLVAPVIAAGATTRDVVLPPGTWVDRATGAPTTGDGHTSITVPAPLTALPMWYRAGSLVPMFAIAADTMLPATAAGVTSYATPAIGGELRLVYTPGAMATATLHDGTTATADGTALTITGGSEYAVTTFDIDARTLAAPLSAPTAITVDGLALVSATDVTTCSAPGCYQFDAPTLHLQVRVFAPTGATHHIAIQ